jgi:hypothetical protein
VSVIPSAPTNEGQRIDMSCISTEAPPAAEQFCAELLRLYQKFTTVQFFSAKW